VKDEFGQKKRVLPSSIVKPSVSLGYGGYPANNASRTASTFRPPERIGDTSYVTEKPVSSNIDGLKSSARKGSAAASTTDEITLSVSQKKVLDTIIARKSVFFTGAAGTGKSYVLKVMRDVLETLGLSDRVTFTAPTGVAACNIRGLTIHAWAGVGTRDYTFSSCLGDALR
jgi:hypothetical protein